MKILMPLTVAMGGIMKPSGIIGLFVLGLVSTSLFCPCASAADQPQWGERYTRNMISTETGLPSTFNLETGENVKWTAYPGDKTYGSPTVAEGSVFIGANNIKPRDPRHHGDRGVLLCLDEADGSLRWQLVVPRLTGDKYKDWPMISMSSPPTVEGNRVYTVTNRFEVVCLDLKGQSNGNDGPYLDEGTHMVPAGDGAMEVTALDADIIWVVDMKEGDIGMYPHDSAYSSILLDGPYLYLNSGNGVDNTHQKIRSPNAPGLVVLEKETGRLVAKDEEMMGPRTIHATWSSPSMGDIGGKRRVFFGGGNGVCYAFEALDPKAIPGSVQALKRVWLFDGDPTAPKENVHDYLRNREVSSSNIKGMPVFYKDRIYVCVGGDIWWGKEKSWLKCIDATQQGDITETGELWSYPMDHHSSSTPAIFEGLLFVTDCAGLLHCIDAETGQPYWTHELKRQLWGSALVADGKVYVGSHGGDFCILTATKEKKVLATIQLDSPISSTPVAANGVLYVTTLKQLYALALGQQ
jgi:outer membrane protein assembly factor BamB